MWYCSKVPCTSLCHIIPGECQKVNPTSKNKRMTAGTAENLDRQQTLSQTFQGHLFKVKCDLAIALPLYDFLLIFYSNIWPNSASLRDIRLRNVVPLTLTFQGHSKSNMAVPLDQISNPPPTHTHRTPYGVQLYV